MVDVPQARIADLPPFGVVAEPARTGNASLTTDSWDDYVSALLRIETPRGVICVLPAPFTRLSSTPAVGRC
jgi:hypothetical protein